MPLNRTNTRSSYRTTYSGITEYATLQRCGPDGNPIGAAELWTCFFGESTQAGESLGEAHQITLRRTITLFRTPYVKWKPPNIGDYITRNRDGTQWEIYLESSVSRKLFGNSAYVVDVIETSNRGR